MSDLIREEFDAWFLANAPKLSEKASWLDPDAMAIRRLARHAWKASREFLVIELPEPYVWDNDGGFERESDPDSECSMALIPKIDVMQSIHAAGVKTK